jgi:hypothetical protein
MRSESHVLRVATEGGDVLDHPLEGETLVLDAEVAGDAVGHEEAQHAQAVVGGDENHVGRARHVLATVDERRSFALYRARRPHHMESMSESFAQQHTRHDTRSSIAHEDTTHRD